MKLSRNIIKTIIIINGFFFGFLFVEIFHFFLFRIELKCNKQQQQENNNEVKSSDLIYIKFSFSDLKKKIWKRSELEYIWTIMFSIMYNKTTKGRSVVCCITNVFEFQIEMLMFCLRRKTKPKLNFLLTIFEILIQNG